MGRSRQKTSNIGSINWTENKNTLIWSLLAELAKEDNHAALYGVQKGNKTIGSTKAKIHKGIASVLFPDLYPGNEDTLATRVKSKIEDLHNRYKKEVKRLTVTGGGLGGNDDSGSQEGAREEHLVCYVPADGVKRLTVTGGGLGGNDDSGSQEGAREEHLVCYVPADGVKRLTVTGGGLGGNDDSGSQEGAREEHLVCYVPADGPDHTTTVEAKNLWDDILAGFPFFKEMHRFLCGRPNTLPPVVTTGVGPNGRHVVHFQPLENGPSSVPSASPPSPTTEPGAVEPVKENIQTPALVPRKGARESSFSMDAIEKAKSSIQRVVKKSFEERLADATEANLKSADNRAAATLRMEKKRLHLDQLSHFDNKLKRDVKSKKLMPRNIVYSSASVTAVPLRPHTDV
ncbi:hypothetical protein D9613_003450 [Agrocybe pediades]|uniref:Uncharacterized protein n=1 Tax=Agrocybe pediades TaxID=84607 RepID=A0A8H4QQN1_9AGAR|nr:hypothetical protein D9613_003450 [Agrocybe pediades]